MYHRNERPKGAPLQACSVAPCASCVWRTQAQMGMRDCLAIGCCAGHCWADLTLMSP